MAAGMEIAFDLMSGLRDRVADAGGTAANGAIDWFGLHARCTAAHAARRELGRFESRGSAPVGSFALWAASPYDPGHVSPVVNRTALADRKVPAGMECGSAAVSHVDGRGQ
jgi:hypothetical protein